MSATHYETSSMDVDGDPRPAPSNDAPTSPTSPTRGIACDTLPPPPPRSARAGPALFSAPTTLSLRSPQPSIDSWTGGTLMTSQPLCDAPPDPEHFTAMQVKLARQKSFSDFAALANASYLGHLVATGMTELDFLRGSGDVSPHGIPSVDALYALAPSVTTLSTNVPFGPSNSPPRIAAQIQSLCVDEANEAVWSANRMTETLEGLNARRIPQLRLQHTSPRTITRCMTYLGTIQVCVFVDDDETRFISFVDERHWTHAYTCAYVGRTPLIFNKLWNLEHLTVNGWMLEHELSLLFGPAFPSRLKKLHIWYRGGDRSRSGRIELLAYRQTGQGRCAALDELGLSTTRPLVAGAGHDAPPMLPVEKARINAFLTHLHGRPVLVEDLHLELDGVTMPPEDCDAGPATPP